MVDRDFSPDLMRLEDRIHFLMSQSKVAPGQFSEILEELEVILKEIEAGQEQVLVQNEALAVARNEIERERQRYIDLFNFAPNGCIVTDLSGIIEEASMAASRLFNSPEQMLYGKPIASLVEDSLRGDFLHIIHLLRQGAETWSGEMSFNRHNGLPFTAEVSMSVLRNPAGDLQSILWIIRDITQRKQMESELLRREEAERRLAAENAALAEIGRIISSSLLIDDVYQQFAEWVHKLIPFDRLAVSLANFDAMTLTRTYVNGTDFPGMEQGTTRPLEGTYVEEVIKRKSPICFSEEHIQKRAAERPRSGLGQEVSAGMRSYMAVPLFSGGQPIGGLTFISSLPHAYSEREARLGQRVAAQIAGAIANAQLYAALQQAHAATALSEERYRGLVDISPEGIYIREDEPGWKILYANPATARLFGFDSHQELVGKSAVDLVHPGERDDMLGVYHSTQGKDENLYSHERRFIRPDGKGVITEVFSAPVNYQGKRARQVFLRDITVLKESQEVLQKREQEFRALVENNPDVVVRLDSNLRYVYANPAIERQTGTPAESLIGKTHLDQSLPEELANRFRSSVSDVFETAQENILEFSYEGPHGLRYYQSRKVPEFGPDGMVQTVLGITRDITDLTRAQQRLLASEERFRALAESTPAAIFIYSSSRFLFANPAAAEISGYSQAELLEMGLFDVVHPRFHDFLKERLAEWQQGKLRETVRFEVQLLTRERKLRWLDVATCNFDFGGEPALLGTAFDITNRKEAEAHIRFQAELLENAQESIVATDLEGRIIYWSKGAGMLFGYSPDEVMGRPYASLLDAGKEDEEHQRMQQTLASGFWRGEYVRRRKDGTTFWADSAISLVKDEAGKPTGFVTVKRDITERKQMEEQRKRLLLQEMELRARAEVANQRTTAQYKLSQVLINSTTLDDGISNGLKTVSETLGWDFAAYWEVDESAGEIYCRSLWHAPWFSCQSLEASTRKSRFHPGSDLPGIVWDNNVPIWLDELPAISMYSRRNEAVGAGVRGMVLLPVRGEYKVIGVLELLSRNLNPSDRHLFDAKIALSAQIGQFIERKMAEQALVESESRYRRMVERSPEPVVMLQADTIITYVNPAFAEMLGAGEPDRLLGISILDFIHPRYQKLASNLLAYPEYATRDYQFDELQLLRLDKQIIDVEVTVIRLNDRGRGPRVELTLKNVTERKRTSMALKLLDMGTRHLTSLSDNSEILKSMAREVVPYLADWCGVYVLQDAGILRLMGAVHIDQEREKLLYTLEQLYPHSIHSSTGTAAAFHKGESILIKEFTDEMLASEARDERHLELLRSLGTTSAMIVPMKSHDRVIGLMMFCLTNEYREYTSSELALAQELAARCALLVENSQLYRDVQEQRSALQTLLDGIVEGVVSTDENTRVLRANSFAARLLNVSADSVVGQKIGDLLHLVARDEVHEQISPIDLEEWVRKCIAENRPLNSDDFYLQAPQATLLPVALTVAPQYSEYGTPRKAVVLIQDISERHQADELRDNIISLVSHELRTPLMHIKGFSSSLIQSDVNWDNETRLDFIRTIDKEADRLNRLIEDILEMSRIQSGRIPLNRKEVSPGTLIRGAARRASPFLADHNVSLHIPSGLPKVSVDPGRVEQVIINLLQNASKYSKDGTPVKVEAAASGEDVTFSVIDSGVGIAPEYHEAVFQKFTRIQPSDQPQAPGTGLGLALSRAIVEAHGGRIWVESVPGQGSNFRFTVPRES